MIENGDMSILEALMCDQTMAACLEILKSLLGDDESVQRANVIIGTV